MPPRRAPLVPSNEADIQLALLSIDSAQIQSTRRAATVFDIPKSTLIDRRAGKRARRDCQPNSRKLTQREEEVIVSYILHLDQRGFAPTYAAARDMADKLLAARGAGQVGQKWPANFVKRTDSLRTCFNQAYDRQRALCENPALIRSWFELIEKTKAELSICDEDIYNFDEAGFIMGKITTQLLGNREWVTLIATISAGGWLVPLFLIFAISDNGWTNNKLRVEWLKHFNAHTQARTIGARRLLIIDGHRSHQSLEFQELCKENNIYTLCMPPHSSHLLQPLDVGCFSPLKRAYSREVESLMRNHINHITKLEFLPAFKIAFD
ncbi:hypothetical protein PtrM4_029060 [Pyrenophora tritici-repentis]|uniref:HTH CENPB-type domain-containing protein n=1 Tax=Pyrenophora tritici-repentis TaxID=45151 RepID=A0A834SA94_9PLEO|nr:hypothetical protein PtrM4_029060 [Pyrenophora tritici-repentis]